MLLDVFTPQIGDIAMNSQGIVGRVDRVELRRGGLYPRHYDTAVFCGVAFDGRRWETDRPFRPTVAAVRIWNPAAFEFCFGKAAA